MRDPSTVLALPAVSCLRLLKEQGQTASEWHQFVSQTQTGLLNSNGCFVSRSKHKLAETGEKRVNKKEKRIPFLTLSGFFLQCKVTFGPVLQSAEEHLRSWMEFQVRSEAEGMQGGDTCFTAIGFVTETAKRYRNPAECFTEQLEQQFMESPVGGQTFFTS